MEDGPSSEEDPPTAQELEWQRRRQMRARGRRVEERLHQEWVRSSRSVGSVSREKALWVRFMAFKPGDVDAPPVVEEDGVQSKRAASAALGRIVAGLKFLPPGARASADWEQRVLGRGYRWLTGAFLATTC
jgi:hypothetical protein